MHVYKYINEFGLNVLCEHRVKVSRADALNDPFELAPQVNPNSITLQHVMRYLSQDYHIDECYRKEGAMLGFTNKKRFKRFYLTPSNLHKEAEKLLPTIPENAEAARKNFAKMFSESWRLFCVSKTKESILMWSHYAEQHKGMVIEFDTTQQPFGSLGTKWILEVKYSESDSRPSFDYIPASGVDNFVRSLMNVVGTKYKDWRYEEEVRMVFPVAPVLAEPPHQSQLAGEFIGFVPSAVRSVFLGCHCPDRLKKSVMQTVEDSEYRHVEVFQAKLSKTEYKVEFTKIRSAL